MENELCAALKKQLADAVEDAVNDSRLEFWHFFNRVEKIFADAGLREKNYSSVKTILILRLDVVGDFVITTGFIREVRKNFPDARITLVVSPMVYPLAELCPYVNEVLVFDGSYTNNNLVTMIQKTADFCIENLLAKNFSLAFCPQWGSDNYSTLFAAWLSGAGERIGYGHYPAGSWIEIGTDNMAAIDNALLTKNIVTPREIISEAQKHFFLLKAAGFQNFSTKMELWFDGWDEKRANELLKDVPQGKRIVLGLGAGAPNRKYPVAKWLKALKKIARRGEKFIIVGGNAEKDDAAFVEQNLLKDCVINLAGKTTLRETATIVSAADMYIGNVTGVMHIAAAANLPIITIYREAKDKITEYPGVLSEYMRFPPWQAPAVVLRPERAIGECADKHNIYGGCIYNQPHCIATVPPDEIVRAYEIIADKLHYNPKSSNLLI